MTDVPSLGEAVLAVGALGTAAFGIVDSTKGLAGGISRVGFKHIVKALAPYEPALDAATGLGRWRKQLQAHWINGRSLDEQKSTAKALVRLGLSSDTAASVAEAGHVDPEALVTVAKKLGSGEGLEDKDLNVLGRFDAALDMDLEAAFDRADQQYRNAAKLLAASFAILLALAATAVLGFRLPRDASEFGLALLIGILAVPLAPVAKDLATGLSAAVKAVQAARKV